jgi:hypothetical protein
MRLEIIAPVFSAICPWLALVWCLLRIATWLRLGLRGWTLLALAGAIATVLLLVPIQGLAIARWVAGLNTNFSVPLTGMLAVAVCQRGLGRQTFAERDWIAGWSFGAIGSLTLYPLALGVSGFDPYEWGWRFSPLFVIVAALSSWLIWKKNRFGILLLVAVVAFHLRLLESSNYWDYLLDPITGLVSLGAMIRRGLIGRARLRPQPELP